MITRPSRESLLTSKTIKLERKIINDLITLVSNEFDISTKSMLSPSRERQPVLARNMSYYILHTYYKQKASQIAPYFKRDRTTVLHGIHTFLNDLEVLPFYMERYEAVMELIFDPKQIYALQ